jgi:hypothetical protein
MPQRSPGHRHDDEVLYGSGKSDDPIMSSNTGKFSGQGTHFGQTRSGGQDPSTADTNSTTTGNIASHHLSSSQLQPDGGESTASIQSGVQGYPQYRPALTGNSGTHGGPQTFTEGGVSTSSTTGPYSSDPSYKSDETEDGASKALGGTTAATGLGAGAVAASTLETPSVKEREEGVADVGETTIDRVYPAGGFSRKAEDESPLTDTTVPKVQIRLEEETHPYGRDVALAGGAGAAGLAGYEETRDKTPTEPSSTFEPVADNATGSDSVRQGYGTRESTQPSTTTGTKKYQNPYQTSHIDPRVDSNPTSRMAGAYEPENSVGSTEKEHHYGRDAGLAAVGAGAVGTGAYAARKHEDKSVAQSTPDQPSSTTTGGGYVPGTDAKTADVQPGTATSTGGYADPDARTATKVIETTRTDTMEPEKEHHYGRDAGLAAGLGAVGAGAYAAEKHRDKTEPASTYDDKPGTSTEREIAPVSDFTTSNMPPEASDTEQTRPKEKQHHYGRDTGLAAAGLGAVGAGAYAADKHRDKTEPTSTYDDKPSTSTERGVARVSGTTTSTQSTEDSTTEQTKPGEKGHHYSRDAEIAAAGIGAGAYGAHDYSKHQAEEAEKERLPQEAARQKELEKERAAREKAAAKEHRAQEKAAAKEQKEHEKEMKKEQKAHEKAIAKEEKQHEKELAAILAAQEKDRKAEQDRRDREQATIIAGQEKERKAEQDRRDREQAAMIAAQEKEWKQSEGDLEKDEKKEKGGFLGMFKRKKSHHEDRELEKDEDDSHKKEAALGAAGVAGAGAAAYGYEKHHHDGDKTTTREPFQEQTTTTEPSGYGKGTAAGLGAVGTGTGAYEADKHLHKDTYDQPDTTRASDGILRKEQVERTSGSHRGAETPGVCGVGAGTAAYEAKERHEPTSAYNKPEATTREPVTQTAKDDVVPDKTDVSHHGAETAAGLGAVGAGAYGAEKLHDKHEADRGLNTDESVSSSVQILNNSC